MKIPTYPIISDLYYVNEGLRYDLYIRVSYFSDIVYGQTNCTGRADGIYGIGCRSFEVCKDGDFTTVDCSPLVYNNDTQQCDEWVS